MTSMLVVSGCEMSRATSNLFSGAIGSIRDVAKKNEVQEQKTLSKPRTRYLQTAEPRVGSSGEGCLPLDRKPALARYPDLPISEPQRRLLDPHPRPSTAVVFAFPGSPGAPGSLLGAATE